MRTLFSLFLQPPCALCQRSSTNVFCQDCERQVRGCKRQDSWTLWQDSLPLFVWGKYEGALKRAIAALKYQKQPQIARQLGQWAAQTWIEKRIAASNWIVVPIPMHPDKQKQRGFNQAELLAETFCQVTGLPLKKQGLERIRETTAQFGLSIAEREQNLTGAFQVSSHLRQQICSSKVLLLDDIYTTGATARTAIAALQKHQIAVAGFVAIARSDKDSS